jgi:hypothetical protein
MSDSNDPATQSLEISLNQLASISGENQIYNEDENVAPTLRIKSFILYRCGHKFHKRCLVARYENMKKFGN